MILSKHSWLLFAIGTILTTAASDASASSDSTLTVYAIDLETPLSAIAWDSWGRRDSIELLPSTHSHPEKNFFTDENDAAVIVKAAGSVHGLHIYCRIRDDSWVQAPLMPGAQYDAVNLYIDVKSPKQIRDYFEALLCSGCGLIGLTYTSQFIQLPVGGATEIPQGYLGEYEPVDWTFNFVPLFGHGSADNNEGFALKNTVLQESVRSFELFLPWSRVGNQSAAQTLNEQVPQISSGSKLAFSVGYNDIDSQAIVPDSCSGLRWRAYEPLMSDSKNDREKSLSAWGELILEEGFDAILSLKAKESMFPLGISKREKQESYSLLGRRIVVASAKKDVLFVSVNNGKLYLNKPTHRLGTRYE